MISKGGRVEVEVEVEVDQCEGGKCEKEAEAGK